jgi:hypothetical protein
MSIILTPVRLYSNKTPYHYTEDNKPLQDLAARDEALKAAVEALGESTQTLVGVGNWATLSVNLNLFGDMDKPFSYRVRIWAIQDQSIAATQVSTMMEDIIAGYSASPGVITILQTWNNYKRTYGGPVLVPSYTPAGNNLNISFAGYTGTNGYVQVKAERFGP